MDLSLIVTIFRRDGLPLCEAPCGLPKEQYGVESPILSAGAEELRKIYPFHISGEFRYCLLTSAFF